MQPTVDWVGLLSCNLFWIYLNIIELYQNDVGEASRSKSLLNITCRIDSLDSLEIQLHVCNS